MGDIEGLLRDHLTAMTIGQLRRDERYHLDELQAAALRERYDLFDFHRAVLLLIQGELRDRNEPR
jgi:hypothetical protein